MSLDIKKLEQSNTELRAIIDSSWDAIGIINEQSKFIYINKAFSPILGFSKEELLSFTFESLINEKYKDKFSNLIKDYKLNNNKDQLTLLCQRKDKQKVYLEITLTRMNHNDFFIINAKDVTAQVSKDQILDSYVASIELDNEGIIKKCSDAFCKLTGFSKNEIINNKLEKIYCEDKLDTYIKAWECFKAKAEHFTSLQYKNKHNEIFVVDVKSKININKYGDITGYTMLFFDTTNENVLKNEILKKDEILLQQSKLAIMGETIQMVSHEWRQPLNVISLSAQTLDFELEINEDIKTEDIRKNLKTIKEKVDDLSSTIENFQNLISLKSQEIKTTSKEIIDIALKIFENSSDFENIDFAKILNQTPEFYTYKTELATILVNLLINAKEAILRKNVKKGVILLKEYLLNDIIYFEVSDNGGGIKEDIIDKIFQPYFSTKEEKHGVGLGLYTCEIITKMHLKGCISIKNHNTGTRVTIAIPAKLQI